MRSLQGLLGLCLITAGATACVGASPDESPSTGAEDLPGARNDAFAKASATYHVPREILMAVGHEVSRFEALSGAVAATPDAAGLASEEASDAHDNADGYGVMGLSAAHVTEAAAITSASEDAIRTDIATNIAAGAALLQRYASESGAPAGSDAAFDAAVVRLFELHDSPEASALAIEELHGLVTHGFDITTSDGERLAVDGSSPFGEQASLAVGQYPPIQFIPAASANFSVGRAGGTVKFVVIHDMEGTQAGSIAVFQNPARQASAHYLLRASDGHLVQMVNEANNAFHAGNSFYNHNSIGIEHEGFADRAGGGGFYTTTQYRVSAQLVCAITRKYGIPIDRAHIFGHGNVPSSGSGAICSDAQANAGTCGGASHHHDPGRFWDWNFYLGQIRQACGAAPPPPNACSVHADDHRLHCANTGGAAMHSQPNAASAVVNHLRTTFSFFLCWGSGQKHAGGNTTWYNTIGDDNASRGWIPAVDLQTTSAFDANPSAQGLPHC